MVKKDKKVITIALGLLFELQTQIVLSNYKSYINNKELINLEEKIEEL